MSHYFGVVLIRPLKEEMTHQEVWAEVQRLMEPFDESIEVEPYKVYFKPSQIVSMAQNYGTSDLPSLADHMIDWLGEPGGVDENGLYSLSTYNPKSRYDYYSPGGRWNGQIRYQPRGDETGYNWDDEYHELAENMVVLKTADYAIDCYSILTPDGEWHSRQRPDVDLLVPDKGTSPEVIAVRRQLWNEQSQELDDLWKIERLDIFAHHSDCVAVGIDYHR